MQQPSNAAVAARLKAHVKYLLKFRSILKKYNKQGAFFDRTKYVDEALEIKQKELLAVVQELHGHGAAQAMSQSMGRREQLRPSRSRSASQLRLRGGMDEEMDDFTQGLRAAVRHAAGRGQPSPSPSPPAVPESSPVSDTSDDKPIKRPKAPKPGFGKIWEAQSEEQEFTTPPDVVLEMHIEVEDDDPRQYFIDKSPSRMMY